MHGDDDGKATFKFLGWVWIGVPAVLGWVGYFAAWLLLPRFPHVPEPIALAGAFSSTWWAGAALMTAVWAFSQR